MQFVYTFSLYIIKGILRTGNMFTLTVNHHIEYNSNPFGMGFMAMNPRINFFLGMACATSPMCMMMPMMPMASIFGMGMMPNAFSNPYPSISFTDSTMNCGFGSMALPMQTVPSLPMMPQMPYIASVPTFSMPTFQFQTFPFISSIYSGSQNSDDTTYNTGYSKIKQGLLKGNLKGKESVITGQKNPRLIIEALAKIPDVPFRMYFIGNGYAAHAMKQLVSELGLDSKVTFVGTITDREELTTYYAASDLFLFPSLYDNAPLVVREAAALHTPAVMAEGSTASTILTDGSNGFLVENDPDKMASLLRELIADPDRVHRVGIQASRTIVRSWEDCVGEVIDRYNALLKSRGLPLIEPMQQ